MQCSLGAVMEGIASQYLSWLMKVRTLSLVKPKPRNFSVQMGVKTQTLTVRAQPRSTSERGASNQRPSLASSFSGTASLCKSGNSSNGRAEKMLCPPLSSEPSKTSCSFSPSPPRCSPKSVKISRKEIQY